MTQANAQQLRKEIEEKRAKLEAWETLDATHTKISKQIDALAGAVSGNASEQMPILCAKLVRPQLKELRGVPAEIMVDFAGIPVTDWDVARGILSVLEAKREEIKGKKNQL